MEVRRKPYYHYIHCEAVSFKCGSLERLPRWWRRAPWHARGSAACGSRLAARKAGKTRADESSLNAEAVCNSGARAAWLSRAGRLHAGGVRRALAAPLQSYVPALVLLRAPLLLLWGMCSISKLVYHHRLADGRRPNATPRSAHY